MRSLEETALGVSGAMVELISKTMRSVWIEVVVGGLDQCNKDRVVKIRFWRRRPAVNNRLRPEASIFGTYSLNSKVGDDDGEIGRAHV